MRRLIITAIAATIALSYLSGVSRAAERCVTQHLSYGDVTICTDEHGHTRRCETQHFSYGDVTHCD